MNPYISDILSQPDALRRAVCNFSPIRLQDIPARIEKGEIDRIVITGMGASYNAAYPAYQLLTGSPLPVTLVNAAELVHYLGGLITPRTMLWMNSQSGRSAELLHLLEQIKSNPPACTLTCVNDETSPMAVSGDILLPIHAGPENTVSTKTYINTMAVNIIAALQIMGEDIRPVKKEVLASADSLERFLESWEKKISELDTMLGDFEDLIVLGRGTSMSAVWNGSLINKEAAKYSLEGMNAAEFRHGPIELVHSGFIAMIFAGKSETEHLNRNLALDILHHGGRVIWMAQKMDSELPTIVLPETTELTHPFMEILPMQLLTVVLAEHKGMTAGQFRFISKVTTRE